MLLDDSEVYAVEPPVQPLDAQRHRLACFRPDEPVSFEPLEEQPQSIATPVENSMRSRRRLPNTNKTDAIGFRRIAHSTRIDSP